MKRRRQLGMVTVEAVLTSALLAFVLIEVIFYGRQFACGAVLDKAAGDAARYLSSVPTESLRDSSQRALVLAGAQSMLEATVAGAGIPVDQVTVEFECGPGSCSSVTANTPLNTVVVRATLQFTDAWFGDRTGGFPVTLYSNARVGRGR